MEIIVAMAPNGAIGINGEIPWHLPEDLGHFKNTTMGHPIIMGRKTWESLPFKPLKGRKNIVITRNSAFEAPGAEVVTSIDAAISLCASDESPFIIGGEQIYRQAMPLSEKLIITEVDVIPAEADAFFPEISPEDWTAYETSDWMTSKTGIRYRFVIYTRKNEGCNNQ